MTWLQVAAATILLALPPVCAVAQEPVDANCDGVITVADIGADSWVVFSSSM